MNQSWKMNASIETVLLKDKGSATALLVKMRSTDVAQELYDLYNYFQDIQKQNKNLQDSITTLRSAITNLLSLSGRKCQGGEFDKVCLNDLEMIQSIMNRVRVDIIKQSEDKPNNDLNGQQNQIDNLQKKIYFLEDSIQQLMTNYNRLSNINNQLFEQNYTQINNLNQLQQKYTQQNKKTSLILFENQLKSVNQNSINIEIDCQQFREQIININNQRQQLIELMQETLARFSHIQSENKVQQNMKNQSLDVNDFKQIINLIKESQTSINKYVEGIKKFVDKINLNPQNLNNLAIQDLLKKLSQNRECFVYIQNVQNMTLKILDQISQDYFQQQEKNKELEDLLGKLKKENIEIKEQLQDQINQLKEYNKKEQQLLSNQMIVKQCLNISNKYNNIFKEFNDQVKKEINRFSNLILILFPNVNEVSNISPDQDLLQDIQSFINSIDNQDIKNDDDSQEQKWQRSIDLFKKIYKRIPNNSIVNQYIIKSVESIVEIKGIIQEYKENVKKFKKEIEMSVQTN
ncbi:unnamed protein product [Paramecium pentaurelia]|uniref:Uncharacterized protein n=1 Tax=Paramecium pentaurelia TaxID=43138 RepID=A0A8S1ULE7_9CILI|nr:unnamed protein product [Paramecium pentaurelia]